MSEHDSSFTYDPVSISGYLDRLAEGEWERLEGTPSAQVSLHLHSYYLQQHIRSGMRVLEIGAGPGRFTQLLADLGTRVTVADISPVQLELNRIKAGELGFSHAVEAWRRADICAMPHFCDATFDAVVAYGGPLSYALDRRDQAL